MAAHLLSLEQAPKPHTVNTQIVFELHELWAEVGDGMKG